MSSNIQSNIQEILDGLSDLDKKQIPYATAIALNDTAFQARDALVAQMSKALDRPTKFTLNAIAVKKASKTKQFAEIYVKDVQAEYLHRLYFGGKELPKKKALRTPTKDLKLNKYGNITRNKVTQLLANPLYFSGKVQGAGGEREGIFRKYKSGRIKQVLIWEDEKIHKKRLEFEKTVLGVANNRLEDNFIKAIEFAISTAR